MFIHSWSADLRKDPGYRAATAEARITLWKNGQNHKRGFLQTVPAWQPELVSPNNMIRSWRPPENSRCHTSLMRHGWDLKTGNIWSRIIQSMWRTQWFMNPKLKKSVLSKILAVCSPLELGLIYPQLVCVYLHIGENKVLWVISVFMGNAQHSIFL